MIVEMLKLFHNVRFYVLVFTVFLSLGMWMGVRHDTSDTALQINRLTQLYGLTALTYLYATLLIGPAVYAFKWLPFRGGIYRSRRAVGVSVFYFGWIHAYLAFFNLLGGFGGVLFLDARYLTAIILSFTALMILTLMAATSFDSMVASLTFKRWKTLHRFVYLAGVLVLIHVVMLGPHFSDLSQPLPQVAFGLLLLLLILQARRFDAYLRRFIPNIARWQPTIILLMVIAIAYVVMGIVFPEAACSLGIHAGHGICTP